LGRQRHSPAHHAEGALAVGHVNDRRRVIRKDRGEAWQVAGVVVLDVEQTPNGVLALRHRVEVAHVTTPADTKPTSDWWLTLGSHARQQGERV
jgi:hypothetical protein